MPNYLSIIQLKIYEFNNVASYKLYYKINLTKTKLVNKILLLNVMKYFWEEAQKMYCNNNILELIIR